MTILKDLKLDNITCQKELLIIPFNITIIKKKKKNYDQPIDSDIKRYEEIRKLSTG